MNQFERFELLVGNKINDIKSKKILVLGLGGVGSYCVEALIRSGIENITIVDNDIIDVSNLNRQLMTNIYNIGNFKTDEIEKRILSINPNCKIKKITKYIDLNNILDIFNELYDYVVDACDTLKVKFELIKICKDKNIKLISCMGTGNKMDPSKLKIIDIRDTSYDPLAKKLRKMVKEAKIKGKIPTICSDEQNYTVIKDKIPTNSFVPATAGLLCASYIINDIVGDKDV